MQGDREVLVASNSAIQSGSRIPSDVFPINKTHSNMVKFSHDDPNYSVVVGFIRQVTERLVPQTRIQVEPGKDKVSVGVLEARIRPQEMELQEERRQRRLAENERELLRGQRHLQSTEEAPNLKPTPTPAREYRDGRICEERGPSKTYLDEGYRYREEEQQQLFTRYNDYERSQDALREKDIKYSRHAPCVPTFSRASTAPYPHASKLQQASKLRHASTDESDQETSPRVSEKDIKYSQPVLRVPIFSRASTAPYPHASKLQQASKLRHASTDESDQETSPRVSEKDIKYSQHVPRVPTFSRASTLPYASTDESDQETSPHVSEKDIKYSRHVPHASTDESDRERDRDYFPSSGLRSPPLVLRQRSVS
jgi:hypothetical protein